MKELFDLLKNQPKAFFRLLAEGIALAGILYLFFWILYIFQL